MAEIPITGIARLAQIDEGSLRVDAELEPIDTTTLVAEVLRGGCNSADVLSRLTSSAPGNPYQFVGEIEGTLASVPPVAVVVRESSADRLLACALFT